jgi:hypothetical protein
MYFLIGYTEEILSALLKTTGKIEKRNFCLFLDKVSN